MLGQVIDAVQVPKAINGMLEETVGWGLVPTFKEMEVVQNLLCVQFQWTATKMEHHMGKTAGIIGKGTLALSGKFDRTLQLTVVNSELRDRFTGPFDQGTTFFS